MAGIIKRNVEQRNEFTALNQPINRDAFNGYKDYCKKKGYPMNVMLEVFMQQYTKGGFQLTDDEIRKWKNMEAETDTLNTTFDKEIYHSFKRTCKNNGYFVKYVVTAFMARVVNAEYRMEFVEVK